MGRDEPICFAGEVSITVKQGDVDPTIDRAALLARITGKQTIPQNRPSRWSSAPQQQTAWDLRTARMLTIPTEEEIQNTSQGDTSAT